MYKSREINFFPFVGSSFARTVDIYYLDGVDTEEDIQLMIAEELKDLVNYCGEDTYCVTDYTNDKQLFLGHLKPKADTDQKLDESLSIRL